MIGQQRTKVEVPELPGGTESKTGSNVERPVDTRTAEQKAAEQKALVEQASKVMNAIDDERGITVVLLRVRHRNMLLKTSGALSVRRVYLFLYPCDISRLFLARSQP